MNLKISILSQTLTITKLSPTEAVPSWANNSPFFSITRTPEELSIVTEQEFVPAKVTSNRGWRMLKVHGPIDFSALGVLHSLTRPLAEAGISIFAISTFDTDYLLLKQEDVDRAIAALKTSGHEVGIE